MYVCNTYIYRCGSKQVCSKALSAKAGCFPKGPGRKSHWLKKTYAALSY